MVVTGSGLEEEINFNSSFLKESPQNIRNPVLSDIYYFHPYLGKMSNLTNIFQMGGSTTNPV